MVAIGKDGPIWTLDIGDTENRCSRTWLDEIEAALDQIEDSNDSFALVTTGRGKFFSNGLDLEWLGQSPDQHDAYIVRVQTMLARFLTVPVPTVAAINGHAFGGGAMLALAHDFRVMRAGRGFFCFPEVDVKIPFTKGMNALITSKVSPGAASRAMTTGRRYTAEDATADGLVDAYGSEDDLLQIATAKVSELAGKDRSTLGSIKALLYSGPVDALRGADQ